MGGGRGWVNGRTWQNWCVHPYFDERWNNQDIYKCQKSHWTKSDYELNNQSTSTKQKSSVSHDWWWSETNPLPLWPCLLFVIWELWRLDLSLPSMGLTWWDTYSLKEGSGMGWNMYDAKGMKFDVQPRITFVCWPCSASVVLFFFRGGRYTSWWEMRTD